MVGKGLPPPTPLLPSPPADPPLSFQGTLPSGLPWAGAVLEEETLERVVVRLSPLGSPVPRWRPALAALSLVDGGALNLRGEAFTVALEAQGAKVKGDWRDGAIELRLEVPPERLAPALLLLEQLILTPAYERFALSEGLRRLERRIRTWPVLASPGGNLPPTGEGLPATEEDLPSSLEMRDWHSKAFHPRWTAMAFCGPLLRKKIQDSLDRTLALWRDPRPAPIPPMPSFPQPGLFWSDRPAGRPTLLSLFLRLGSLGSAWWGPIRVLSRALSGEIGQGRLPAALEAGGLPFLSYRSRTLTLAPNLALRIFQVEGIPPESLPRALEIMVDTLSGLTQKPLSDTEVQTARLGALAEEALTCREPSLLLDRLLQVAATPGGVAQGTPPLQALREALVRTTLSDLRRAAPAFLPNRAWILAQGPREARKGSAFERAMIIASEPEIPGAENEPPPAPLPSPPLLKNPPAPRRTPARGGVVSGWGFARCAGFAGGGLDWDTRRVGVPLGSPRRPSGPPRDDIRQREPSARCLMSSRDAKRRSNPTGEWSHPIAPLCMGGAAYTASREYQCFTRAGTRRSSPAR